MATINRYTIQGSIVVDQRPLTPPTPRYFDFVRGKFKAQINKAGTYAIVFVDTNTRKRDRTEDIIFYDYADEQIAEYKEALLANMMQFYTKIN